MGEPGTNSSPSPGADCHSSDNPECPSGPGALSIWDIFREFGSPPAFARVSTHVMARWLISSQEDESGQRRLARRNLVSYSTLMPHAGSQDPPLRTVRLRLSWCGIVYQLATTDRPPMTPTHPRPRQSSGAPD